MYDVAAQAIKSVDSALRVGGPATAQAAWVEPFIHHVVDHRVPVDFVSTHVYGNDSAENVLSVHDSITRTQMVGRAVRKVYEQVKASPRPNLPIIFSEYNASYKNEPEVTDAVFMGPWLADTIRQCDGQVDMLAYWTMSDVFEEQGVIKQPFYGGYGLLAEGGLPKPAFNAFKLLHKLGNRRFDAPSSSALITRQEDGTLVAAVWNLWLPEEQGTAKEMTIRVKDMESPRHVRIFRLDSAHGSLLSTYDAMGRPTYPTRGQFAALRTAAELPDPEVRSLERDGIRIAIPPHGLVVLEIQ